MESLIKMNGIEELSNEDKNILKGGWVMGLVNAVLGASYFAYQLGKDSYYIHPESLI